MPLSITEGALAWQRLAEINKHPRDERILFEEESHTYTIDGTRAGWTSCTGFLHNFFGHFDADAVIAKMMTSPKWFESKYFGMTAEEIKKQWSDKGKASSEAGTRMHLDIEHFYNAMPAGGYLSVANLHGANLIGAYLSGADLYGADLHGADLYGANLHGAIKVPIYCKWTHGITSENLIHIGCEKRTVEEWDIFFASDEVLTTQRDTKEFKQIQAVYEAYKAYLKILQK